MQFHLVSLPWLKEDHGVSDWRDERLSSLRPAGLFSVALFGRCLCTHDKSLFGYSLPHQPFHQTVQPCVLPLANCIAYEVRLCTEIDHFHSKILLDRDLQIDHLQAAGLPLAFPNFRGRLKDS